MKISNMYCYKILKFIKNDTFLLSAFPRLISEKIVEGCIT